VITYINCVKFEDELRKDRQKHVFCLNIVFITRDSIYAIARICYRPSVRLSDGWIIEKRLKLGL